MAESVETGGLMKFNYTNNSSKLDDERKRGIDEAYAVAEERERKTKRNKIIWWILLALLFILIVGYFILKK